MGCEQNSINPHVDHVEHWHESKKIGDKPAGENKLKLKTEGNLQPGKRRRGQNGGGQGVSDRLRHKREKGLTAGMDRDSIWPLRGRR